MTKTAAGRPDLLSDQLTAFANSVEGTSLYLLRAITQTVDNLGADERLARATAEIAASLTKRIRERKPVVGQLIDPDDSAIAGLESGYSGLESALPALVLKKDAVEIDGALDDDHRDLLHSAFKTCIEALAQLIEATKDLRAAVIQHDLGAEVQSPDTFETVSDLSKSLRSSA